MSYTADKLKYCIFCGNKMLKKTLKNKFRCDIIYEKITAQKIYVKY